ncbi:MAG TPA: hypothetical protein VNO18_24845 [Xanthobacteraceae bacterium]|jgi:hypothetical protein|nr:hypothetical protein [Xanthobacteraceae bacterium]
MSKFCKHLVLTAATGLLALAAGSALAFDADDRSVYIRTDLVSNVKDLVQPKDTNLQNAWGGCERAGRPALGFR